MTDSLSAGSDGALQIFRHQFVNVVDIPSRVVMPTSTAFVVPVTRLSAYDRFLLFRSGLLDQLLFRLFEPVLFLLVLQHDKKLWEMSMSFCVLEAIAAFYVVP